MRLSVISFTEKGKQLSEKLRGMLESDIGIEVELFVKSKACMDSDAGSDVSGVKISVSDWAKVQMQDGKALLFIGACGIAVRAIAPHLANKLRDVPVLVMDEKGKYIIPILSGHVGGANELAGIIAKKTGAEAVVTTATDLNQKFAVDLFAKRNDLSIINKEGIVKVSSKVLSGKEVIMSIEPGYGVEAPFGEQGACGEEGVRLVPYPPAGAVDVLVSSKSGGFDYQLLLQPKEFVIGIGCKKGKSAEELGGFITKKLEELGICAAQVFALASISLKREEPGILQWCRMEGVLFFTYTAEELQEVKGTFSGSAFVKEKAGVDNVCERAALKASGERGRLVLPKCAENGMTIAIAKRDRKGEIMP